MAPSTEPMRAVHSSRSRPNYIVPIVPIVPLPSRSKSKRGSGATVPSLLRERSDVSQSNGSAVSTPVAEDAVTQPSADSFVKALDAPVEPVAQGKSTTVSNHGSEDAIRGTEPISSDDMEQPVPRQYLGYRFPPATMNQHGHPSGPPSTESSSNLQYPPPFNNMPVQHTHPGGNGVAFGNYSDSNSSSPALPQFPMHPPPGFIDHNFQPPFHPPGHQHHLSEPRMPYISRPNNPNFNPRPDVFLPPRPGFPYPPQQYGRMPSFAPPEGYSPYAPGTPVSGEYRAYPPPPIPPQAAGARAFSGAPLHPGSQQGQDGPLPSAHSNMSQTVPSSEKKAKSANEPGSVVDASQRNLLQEQFIPVGDDSDGLLQYLQSQFDVESYADYALELQHVDEHFKRTWYVHGVLLARSPTLKAMMDSATRKLSVEKRLRFETADRFVSVEAFSKAIQRLYGMRLLTAQKIMVSGDHPSSRCFRTLDGQPVSLEDVQARMNLVLGYAAAGCLLQINAVARRGVEAAANLIAWETLEKVFAFSMEGGLGLEWASRDVKSLASTTPSVESRQSAPVEEISRPGSASASSLNSPQDISEELTHVPSGGIYAPYSDFLLQQALDFVMQNFPTGFILDTSAPQFVDHPRLPVEEAFRPKVNPKLSSMRFGDNPTEDDIKRSNLVTTILSSTLLSLPFPLLKHILESSKLGSADSFTNAPQRHKVARAVVDEREKRRREVLSRTDVSNEDRSSNTKAWGNVGWEESVVIEYSGQTSGVELKRKWKGFLLPSRKNKKMETCSKIEVFGLQNS